MGDYNDLRQSAVTGVPEDRLHDARMNTATQVARPEQRGVNAVRDRDQNIQLYVGAGLFVLSDKEALAVIEQLAKVLRS